MELFLRAEAAQEYPRGAKPGQVGEQQRLTGAAGEVAARERLLYLSPSTCERAKAPSGNCCGRLPVQALTV
jgi:hypothetical protein